MSTIESISKYNLWANTSQDVGFERTHYLENIEKYIGNSLIKVLIGQRRSGKSFLLRQILKKLVEKGVPVENTLYINTEFMEYDFIKDYTDLVRLVQEFRTHFNPSGKVYLFLDEIQSVKSWEKAIDSYSQDFIERYEIFISGSNSKLLSGELASLLSGRYISFQIFPFSFEEFCGFKKIEPNKQSFTDFIQSGSLPELFFLPDSNTKRHYVSAIRETVLLRDIIQRYNIKDAKLLDDIFSFLVNNASNLISIPKIVNFFKSKNRKTNYETISNYIQYIENTFLIHKAERYNIKGKDIISGNCKYYINDLSFKNFIYSGFEYGIGYLLENAVYLKLIQSDFEVFVGTLRNGEIDFVAKKNDIVLYFQVTYLLSDENIIEREYNAFNTIRDNYRKYVVSMDDIKLPSRNGIEHIQVWKLKDVLKE